MRLLMALAALLTLGACTHVAPYQRARLAHASMSPSDGESAGRDHVHAVHEGAMGGQLSAGSGCGCN